MDNLVGQFAMNQQNVMDLHYTNKGNNSRNASTGLRHLDPETDFKVRRIVAQVNETAHMAANEPTMGLYRIQEHVHRTLPQVVQRKNELKENLSLIDDAVYDLNLSVDVIDSMSYIPHFTRIHEALKTAIETKRKLNIREEQENARIELDQRNAALANRSISQNEPAEGYICPICLFALTSQDELITHWQQNHSLDTFENDCFEDVDMPAPEGSTQATTGVTNYVVKQDNDLTVIDIQDTRSSQQRLSETVEDVVKSFDDKEGGVTTTTTIAGHMETSEMSASDASGDSIQETQSDGDS